jgi:hypothetical protein
VGGILEGSGRNRWEQLLDTFEREFAAYDGHLMWMADFIRAVMTCRGYDQLCPGTSHATVFITRLADGSVQPDSPHVCVSVDRFGVFTLSRTASDGRGQVEVRRSVQAALKTFRVQVRYLGIRLRAPHREHTVETTRRLWVFFEGGRLG